MAYTDKSIKYLKELRESGLDWSEVTAEWNDSYSESEGKKTLNALRKCYKRWQDVEDLNPDLLIKNLKTTQTARKTASQLRKENKALSDHLITADEICVEFQKFIGELKIKKIKLPKIPKPAKSKIDMIMEPMISDVHVGLKTESYNYPVTRARMQKYSNTILDEFKRYSKNYNIVLMRVLGIADYMQNATMHKDAHLLCDMTNAQQIAHSVETLFYDFFLPIGATGLPVEVIGMCGNHDRESEHQVVGNPGVSYFTYTIYTCLEMLCQAAGLKNIKFIIPKGHYYVYDAFGKHFLVEHGYLVKKLDSKTMENEIIKRVGIEGKIIQGIRMGHYHNDYISSCGRYIVNGGFPSDDHYGDMLGYKSRPCQVINYYVKTKRDTSYYHSFVVNLQGVK